MKKRLLLIMLFLATAAALSVFWPFPGHMLDPSPVISLRLQDRDGRLLREVLSDEGGTCRWVKIGDVSPDLVKATLAAEDKNFFFHRGVSLPSVTRAAWQNLREGEIVSGASTITQQLVRNLCPGRRTIWAKLREAWLALRLERTVSKEEILVQYLNRICYGNQTYGIAAASSLYFDKPPSQLSAAEAAFLAAIPRSPAQLSPYRSLDAVKRRRDQILNKMRSLGYLDRSALERALEEKIDLVPEDKRFRAPHFCDLILSRISRQERRELSFVTTTLDYPLQEKVEILLRNHLRSLEGRGIANGAAVVLDNATAEVLSLVGSADFFDEARDGQVNGAVALRQPGSTLKPFTYALALERGLTAASLLDDSPVQSAAEADYMPQNYDRKYHGRLSLRTALACSYNVPAVSVLQIIGPDLLYRRLKALGFESLRQNPSHYGVGLTLGNGEVRLLELAVAYSALARQGVFLPERPILLRGRKDGAPAGATSETEIRRRVFSPQVTYLIIHILADRDARVPSFGYNTSLSFPFPVAAKTGTSKDFRDNWVVGFSPRYTVAVWVGNFDGKPMHNVSGITGCGPVFRDIMLYLHERGGREEFPQPEGIERLLVCPLSGELPTPLCPATVEEFFIRGTEPQGRCALHRQESASRPVVGRAGPWEVASRFEVGYPRTGSVFKLDPVLRQEHQRIKLRASLPSGVRADGVEWWVNGKKVGEAKSPYSLFWNLRPGSFTIQARLLSGGKEIESRPVKILVLS